MFIPERSIGMIIQPAGYVQLSNSVSVSFKRVRICLRRKFNEYRYSEMV